MFTKILQKVTHSHQNVEHASVTSADLKPRVSVHYGIPSTASVLAFDPIQHLLAIGTQDGKIKVIGGDNIEALLISSKPVPLKNLEFFQNQGFLVSVSNENEIQIWDLQHRCIASNLKWESNITAFSLVYGTHYMYVGDEYGFLSVLKYDSENGNILPLPYSIPANLIDEVSEISSLNQLSIVGILPQPGSSGNRVLIAYENGLIILWDVTEDRTVLSRGNKNLQLKDKIVIHSQNGAKHEHTSATSSDHEQDEKEISSLCWVSSDGSILAVGYVDGDILLWNLSNGDDQKTHTSSNNVIKLQLSSADRRIPVIVLHWCESNDQSFHGGQLFVYGGDEIGTEEILTIISLDWSSGLQTLKCVHRVDLTLDGSFADMILMPNTVASASSNKTLSSLFVLTNPGQLFFYDDSCLSSLASQSGKKHSLHAVQYPVIIPTIEPYMTVGKLGVIYKDCNFSRSVSEAAARHGFAHAITPATTNWPLTGGIPSKMYLAENKGIDRIYIGGYKDGSVRIWDATFPTLSLLYLFESQVEGIEVAGASSSVSAVDFLSPISSLAIGNESGLVRIHKLIDGPDEMSLHFVTARENEVKNLASGNKTRCTSVFSLLDSPVRTLQYINNGAKLAIGFECGGVAMIDVNSSQLLFLSESVSKSHSPVISLDVKLCPHLQNHEENVSKNSNDSEREIGFILTKDAHIILIDSTSGEMIGSQPMHQNKDAVAISMHFIEGPSEVSEHHSLISSQGSDDKSAHNLSETKTDPSSQKHLGKTVDSYILLVCEDSLHVYSPISVVQGKKDTISKTNLVKPCCWTAVFRRDDRTCGLILVYQNGEIEIRSMPDLKVVGETSLMSVIRWNFKTNMDKTMSSSITGQISLANGCEFAFISLFAFENDFRIPESLPCLHDNVLAAASDAAFSVSSNQKKQAQSSSASGLFGGLIQGLKGGKMDQSVETTESRETVIAHLESIFSRLPFSDLSTTLDLSTIIPDDKKVVELNIDDIQIDELPISSVKITKERKDKEVEREKLFEGGSVDATPKMRTPDEIMAKYRGTDAAAAAAHARDKLIERREKLEKLSLHTQELQDGAQNFSSLAGELAKQMKNRKWWQL